jgi:TM2 domain-containing membrane protein YozV
MAKVLKYLPELEGDEQIHVAQLLKQMDEEEAIQFANMYRSRRRDPTTILLMTLLGFIVIAGVQRFYVGQLGMGLLYLFTGGLCAIGTIVDIVKYKEIATRYNKKQADNAADQIFASS